MDLRFTILGILSWKPASGYDLKRMISDSEVFYWSGNNNQIYKSLVELHQEGLVTYQVQAGDSAPAKKIYTITEAGLQTLEHSLLAAPELPELRKGFLIQLAWAEALSDAQVLALLEQYEAELANRLAMYRALAARTGGWPERSRRERFLWQSIAENLAAACQTELEWARQTRQALQEKQYLE